MSSKDKEICQGYRILKKLGSGAYGKVYKVEKNNKIYAIKSFMSDPEKGVSHDNIIEMDILSRVNHPNVLAAQDITLRKIKGYCSSCVILDLADNNLYEYLKKMISRQDKYKIMFDIACGLNYLHKNLIVHRDLKPENILMKGKIPMIADFGMSKLFFGNDQLPIPDYKFTTITYRAPEIWEGNYEYDTKVDIWALGIIFFEIMAPGTKMFPITILDELERRYHPELFNSLFNQEKINRNIRKNIADVELADLITDMLQLNPEYRFNIIDVLNHSFFLHKYYCVESRIRELEDVYDIKPYDSNNIEDNVRELSWIKMKKENNKLKFPLTVWFMGIDIFDRFVSTEQGKLKPNISKEDLIFYTGLIASVCWMLAAKLDDKIVYLRYISKINENVDPKILSDIECSILDALKFNLFRPNLSMIYDSFRWNDLYEIMLTRKSPRIFTVDWLDEFLDNKMDIQWEEDMEMQDYDEDMDFE